MFINLEQLWYNCSTRDGYKIYRRTNISKNISNTACTSLSRAKTAATKVLDFQIVQMSSSFSRVEESGRCTLYNPVLK